MDDTETFVADAMKVENTDKATTAEDGDQPIQPELWNDDTGEALPAEG